MKKILLILACIITAIATKAQYVTVPDSNFAVFISNTYPGAITNFNQLDTTNVSVLNATEMDCNNKGIADLEGLQYFKNLHKLECKANHLTSLIPLPPTLTDIDCSSNFSLGTLPTLPLNIQNFRADICDLTTLPSLPASLRTLSLNNNRISTIPALPDSLRNLHISFNNISLLPPLNRYLVGLIAMHNQITRLDSIPRYLTDLNVDDNLLDSLPKLYYDNVSDTNYLSALSFNNNNISYIPLLKDPLYLLWAQGNKLTTLPELPATLKYLYVRSNLLDSLPSVLPPNLKVLGCDSNAIVTIPFLPNSVQTLRCGSPSLVTITNFPSALASFTCTNSPNLHCLPYIGTIQNMYLVNTGIGCFPNYGTILESTPANINSVYPLCTPDINSACPSYANLAGRVYTDDNHDCTLNNNEVGQANVRQELWSNGTLQKVAYTGGAGYYSFDADTAGEYTILTDTTNALFISGCPSNGMLHDTLTANDSIHLNRNFALRCKPGFNLVAQSVSTAQIFRPANNTVVDIHAGDLANFYGANCAASVAGSVTVNIIGPATYVAPANGALTPSSVAGHILTWNVADFANVNFNTSFGIVVQTDTFAQIGQQVCFELHVTPTVGDNDSSNNTLLHCFNIVNSYDPNDKQAYPSGLTDTADKWITYTVRFQNTGTADAQHIYIMDTLDANVDARTFQLLAYSHQPNIQVNEHIIRFNFPYINLPDSNSNEPGSHGYVQYKVKMKEGLDLGMQIKNTAYIYFDFNPPVITNTTLNTITTIIPTGIPQPKVIALNLYPNPATQQLTVTTAQQGGVLNVYSTQGALLATYTMQGSAQTIDIATLASGVYYVEVNNKDGIGRKKFVKL